MAAISPKNALYQPAILAIAQDKLKLDTFLTLFTKALTQRERTFSISRSLDGIEYTYIANYVATNESLALHENGGKFVLKFKPANEARNEKFCARALRLLGMITPIVRLIKHDTRNGKSIVSDFRSKLQDLEEIDANTHIVFMPAFEADTMQALIQNGKLKNLTSAQLGFLFRKLGELAVYDLLIGNNDRLFKLDSASSTPFSLLHCNGHNIMLSIDQETLQVLAIDNSSYELEDEHCVSSLYDRFKLTFSYVIKEKRQQEFAQYLLSGISKYLTIFPGHFLKKNAEESLLEGVIHGSNLLRKLDQEKFLAELTYHAKTPLARKTLQLIQENLSQLT